MTILSTHMTHGFKTALAAVLAYTITNALALEFGYWAVISTVIVMQVYVADSVEMCLYRFSGTIIGAMLGVLVILFIPKTPIPVGIALFVTIGLCSFLTRYKKRYRMAAITVVIVVMTGLQTQDALMFGVSRVLEIGIGIICAFAVSVLVFPKRKVDVLRAKLEAQANHCADSCRVLVDAFLSRQRNVEESLLTDLVKDVWDNHALLQKIRQNESLIYHKKFKENFALKVSVISRSVEHLRNMAKALNALDDNGYEIIMSRELKNVAEKSGRALVVFVKNEPLTVKDDLERTISELNAKFLNIREEGLIRRFDAKKLIQVFSFYSSLLYFSDDILSGINEL
ncbi:MAG: FUSC family protein [Desulfobacteraceae bacterium]|nr:FUSC family protein [Desulfobacteraceae bacterium]MBC2753747.1 FUSC family protein [Desulfobacteraceae bacterium]